MPNLVNSVIGVAPVIDDLYDPDSESKDHETTLDVDLNESKLITAPNQLLSGKIVYGGGEYYPTLQRTLYILGRMYGSIPVLYIFYNLY